MQVSKHAEKRIRKRLGIPRKAIAKFIDEAETRGTPLNQFKGRVKKFYDAISIRHSAGNKTFSYRDYLFIMQDDILITVYEVPKYLQGKV
jgi:hypothetical protein